MSWSGVKLTQLIWCERFFLQNYIKNNVSLSGDSQSQDSTWLDSTPLHSPSVNAA